MRFVAFVADDDLGLWRRGDVGEDHGQESSEVPLRVIRLRRTGETLSLTDPFGRGLIVVVSEREAEALEWLRANHFASDSMIRWDGFTTQTFDALAERGVVVRTWLGRIDVESGHRSPGTAIYWVEEPQIVSAASDDDRPKGVPA